MEAFRLQIQLKLIKIDIKVKTQATSRWPSSRGCC